MSERAEPAEAPLCPYCGAPWTAGMLAQLESQSSGVFCACCAGQPRPGHIAGPLKLPTQDLCCDSCGKPIYRAPDIARQDQGIPDGD